MGRTIEMHVTLALAEYCSNLC